jgi:CYTH domain-containing protein
VELSIHQVFTVPEWIAEKISHDRRYSNSTLSLVG